MLLSSSAIVRDRFVACGMPAERMAPWTLGIGFTPVARAERDPATPLRLGFVGSFLPSNGATYLLVEAAARLPAGSVTVDLAGAPVDYHGDDSYRRRLTPWLAHPVVRRHGVVPHDRMLTIAAKSTCWCCRRSGWRTRRWSSRKRLPPVCQLSPRRLGGMAEMIATASMACCSHQGHEGARRLPGPARSRTGSGLRVAARHHRAADHRARTSRVARPLPPPGGGCPDRAPVSSGRAAARRGRGPQLPHAAEQTWLAVRLLRTSFCRPSGSSSSTTGPATVLRRRCERCWMTRTVRVGPTFRSETPRRPDRQIGDTA